MEKKITQRVVVSTPDKLKWIKTVVELANQGLYLRESTIPTMSSTLGYKVEMEKIINSPEEAISSTPIIRAFPPSYQKYSKEELVATDWDSFRVAVATQGIKGRDRTLMLEKYLEVVAKI